jgi:hypothetical protein
MKTLSGRFRFVVFGVIVIVAVVSCRNFPFIPDIISYCVEIGSKQQGKYVEWKDQGQFDAALKQVCAHNGNYELFFVMQDRDKPRPYPTCTPPPGNIRTVKVTKSKVADNPAAREPAVNDPHVTYRVTSAYPGDISKVLDALNK